jgi:ATP-dependent Clp protease ATP-binding subunit ClpA
MARLLQDRVKRPLADELLFGKLIDGGRVTVDGGGPASWWSRRSEPKSCCPRRSSKQGPGNEKAA